MNSSPKSLPRWVPIAVVMLVVAGVVWLLWDRPRVTGSGGEQVAPGGATSSSSEKVATNADSSSKSPPPSDAADGSNSVDMGWARGTGYALGNLIKEVFAKATTDGDGRKHIDLSSITTDWSKSRRTVVLEDAKTPSRLRGEYFAAILCGALDVPTERQATLAAVMERFYERDRLDKDEAAREQTRAGLSKEARSELLALLPKETLDRFREMTSHANFPFHAASFAADSALLGEITTSGESVIILHSNGGLEVTGDKVIKRTMRRTQK